MAHQCLKCGKTYPDGSAQILKGCEGCKGTRFFYTQAPLADDERQDLADQAEIDLERLALGKGARDAATPRHIPTKDELPVGREREPEWVAGGPNYLRGVVEDVVRRAHERKPVFRVGEPVAPKKSLAEWVAENRAEDAPEQEEGSTEILDDLFSAQREAAWRDVGRDDPAVAEDPGAPPAVDPPSEDVEEDVVYQRAPRPIPKPVSLAGAAIESEEDATLREEARRARDLLDQAKPTPKPKLEADSGVERSLYPEGEAPETVAISGSGVYELDVKRLLEKNPIVVHKDGTYSLHLPSLMETLEGRKKR